MTISGRALRFVKAQPMATAKAIFLTLVGTGAVLEAMAAVRELVPRTQPAEFEVFIVKRADFLAVAIELQEGDVKLIAVKASATSPAAALEFVTAQSQALLGAAKPC